MLVFGSIEGNIIIGALNPFCTFKINEKYARFTLVLDHIHVWKCKSVLLISKRFITGSGHKKLSSLYEVEILSKITPVTITIKYKDVEKLSKLTSVLDRSSN